MMEWILTRTKHIFRKWYLICTHAEMNTMVVGITFVNSKTKHVLFHLPRRSMLHGLPKIGGWPYMDLNSKICWQNKVGTLSQGKTYGNQWFYLLSRRRIVGTISAFFSKSYLYAWRSTNVCTECPCPARDIICVWTWFGLRWHIFPFSPIPAKGSSIIIDFILVSWQKNR